MLFTKISAAIERLNPTKSFSEVAQNLATGCHPLGAGIVCVTPKSSA